MDSKVLNFLPIDHHFILLKYSYIMFKNKRHICTVSYPPLVGDMEYPDIYNEFVTELDQAYKKFIMIRSSYINKFGHENLVHKKDLLGVS